MPSRCRGGIAEERSNPQPMMNGMEKSDSGIVCAGQRPDRVGWSPHGRSGRGRHIQKWG